MDDGEGVVFHNVIYNDKPIMSIGGKMLLEQGPKTGRIKGRMYLF